MLVPWKKHLNWRGMQRESEVEAAVSPLLKKGAKDSGHKNLRPVSNLQFVSKITEKAVFNQIYAHITENGLLTELQSAYRSAHSTETALLQIVNDILLNMNSQPVFASSPGLKCRI